MLQTPCASCCSTKHRRRSAFEAPVTCSDHVARDFLPLCGCRSALVLLYFCTMKKKEALHDYLNCVNKHNSWTSFRSLFFTFSPLSLHLFLSFCVLFSLSTLLKTAASPHLRASLFCVLSSHPHIHTQFFFFCWVFSCCGRHCLIFVKKKPYSSPALLFLLSFLKSSDIYQ